MGKEKSSSSTTNVTNQTQTTQPTEEERRLNQLEIQRIEAVQPGQIQTQQTGLSLINSLLSGQEPLPGFFQKLSEGISPEMTSDIARQAVEDIRPQFQASGILDSGVAASISGRVAGDIRRSIQEFNIGNKFNLLNLALSGQAQVQQPLLAQSQILSGRLAGLRPVTTSGSSTQNVTNYAPNPFISSYQRTLGESLGGKNVHFNFGLPGAG